MGTAAPMPRKEQREQSPDDRASRGMGAGLLSTTIRHPPRFLLSYEYPAEPFLLEMAIGRQGDHHAAVAHEDEAYRVAQGILLVWTSLQQLQRLAVERAIIPDDNDIRVVQ